MLGGNEFGEEEVFFELAVAPELPGGGVESPSGLAIDGCERGVGGEVPPVAKR